MKSINRITICLILALLLIMAYTINISENKHKENIYEVPIKERELEIKLNDSLIELGKSKITDIEKIINTSNAQKLKTGEYSYKDKNENTLILKCYDNKSLIVDDISLIKQNENCDFKLNISKNTLEDFNESFGEYQYSNKEKCYYRWKLKDKLFLEVYFVNEKPFIEVLSTGEIK